MLYLGRSCMTSAAKAARITFFFGTAEAVPLSKTEFLFPGDIAEGVP